MKIKLSTLIILIIVLFVLLYYTQPQAYKRSEHQSPPQLIPLDNPNSEEPQTFLYDNQDLTFL